MSNGTPGTGSSYSLDNILGSPAKTIMGIIALGIGVAVAMGWITQAQGTAIIAALFGSHAALSS